MRHRVARARHFPEGQLLGIEARYSVLGYPVKLGQKFHLLVSPSTGGNVAI